MIDNSKKMQVIAIVCFLFFITMVSLTTPSDKTKNTYVYAGVSVQLNEMLWYMPEAMLVVNSNKNTMTNIPENTGKIGWVKDVATIKKEPNEYSTDLAYAYFNEMFSYWDYDEKWVCVFHEGEKAYILKDELSTEAPESKTVQVPWNPEYKGNKTWMNYESISDPTTNQYKLKHMAYTGNFGVRMYNSRYLIAVGTGVTDKTGTYLDVVLENGFVIPCIVGDIKADIHTDASNIFTMHSICCSEALVDLNVLNADAKYHGDMSWCMEELDSKVDYFIVYDKNVFDEP